MTADSFGSKGQPLFDSNKPPDTAVDQNLISNFAAKTGNRIVGSEDDRSKLTAAGGAWPGLLFHVTETGYNYEYFAGFGWKRQIFSGNGLVIRSGFTEVTTNINGDATINIEAFPAAIVGAVIQDAHTSLSNGLIHSRFNLTDSRPDKITFRLRESNGSELENFKTQVFYIACGY
jgi:hypothetical protein